VGGKNGRSEKRNWKARGFSSDRDDKDGVFFELKKICTCRRTDLFVTLLEPCKLEERIDFPGE
jgi:hypothetical protein